MSEATTTQAKAKTGAAKEAAASPKTVETFAINQNTSQRQAQNGAFKSYEDALQVSKEGLTAWADASRIFLSGIQSLNKSVLSFAQSSIEDQVIASKTLLSAKSLKELMDAQSSITKSWLDKVLAETESLSEASVKLAEDSLAPINAHLSTTVEKLTKAAA